MMNVVFISSQHYPLGMAGSKRIKLFAEFLAKKNTVKVIVATDSNGSNQKTGTVKNVAFQFIQFTKLQTILGYFKVKTILRSNFSAIETNILFLYDNVTLTNFLFASIGKKMGYKIVTDIVEDYSLSDENESFLRKVQYKISTIIQKKLHWFVDGVVVISEYLFKKYNHLNKKILITISAENLSTIFPKTPASDIINMVYSGSFGNKDGITYLIEAFNNISEKYKNTELLLSGKISTQILNHIKGNDKIKYVGMIPDADYYSFLNQADILLMTRVNTPYANAGFPFKLGEYLATGKPVIATKVSGVEIYLNDKEDVIFAEPSSVDSLVQAFEFVVTNHNKLQKIGNSGKEKCAQFFDPEKNGEKLEGFLNSLSLK